MVCQSARPASKGSMTDAGMWHVPPDHNRSERKDEMADERRTPQYFIGGLSVAGNVSEQYEPHIDTI